MLGDEFLTTAANSIADAAGQIGADQVGTFLEQRENARQLLEAFQDADMCFASKCGDPLLCGAIRDLLLANPLALEKLAAKIPQSFDAAGLRQSCANVSRKIGRRSPPA